MSPRVVVKGFDRAGRPATEIVLVATLWRQIVVITGVLGHFNTDLSVGWNGCIHSSLAQSKC